jgi:hypothetical protein
MFCCAFTTSLKASVSESFLFAADSMQGTRQCVPSTGIDQANLKEKRC